MATIKHPITGIELNPITIERKALSYREAVTAWMLRLSGVKYNHVAQFLGTNTHGLIMPGDCDYKWHWARLGRMLLNGEHLFAVVQAGGKDTSTVNEGVSVLWQVCAPVEGGGMTDCRARGEIKFTSFNTTEAEFATAKRLAKSTLNALEKAFT